MSVVGTPCKGLLRNVCIGTILGLLCCRIAPAHAQALTLSFGDAGVTLKAQNVPVRTILTEWARLGGVTIVNGDGVVGPPVTLELENVPERQALDILLRSVSGYMLGSRLASTGGASQFDRILILPSSVPPRTQPGAPTLQAPRPATVGPARPPVQIVQEPEQGDSTPQGPEDSDQLMQRPELGPREVPVTPRPFEGQQAPAGIPPSAANPFGVPFGTTSTPGIITPVPQQQPQQQPQPATPAAPQPEQ